MNMNDNKYIECLIWLVMLGSFVIVGIGTGNLVLSLLGITGIAVLIIYLYGKKGDRNEKK